MEVSLTLLTDGSSDRVLRHPVAWLMARHGLTARVEWANPSALEAGARTLADRVRSAVRLHPCQILLVHRDAEKVDRETRVEQIRQAVVDIIGPPAVCLVPVRMTEAWLLIDEPAIRQAADNPAGFGKIYLECPRLDQLEGLADPKSTLHRLLEQASGLAGRRLRNFRPHQRVHRLGELIVDYSPLLRLPAFQAFQEDILQATKQIGATQP